MVLLRPHFWRILTWPVKHFLGKCIYNKQSLDANASEGTDDLEKGGNVFLLFSSLTGFSSAVYRQTGMQRLPSLYWNPKVSIPWREKSTNFTAFVFILLVGSWGWRCKLSWAALTELPWDDKAVLPGEVRDGCFCYLAPHVLLDMTGSWGLFEDPENTHLNSQLETQKFPSCPPSACS